MNVTHLIEGARHLASRVPPSDVDEVEGIREYQDGDLTIISRGKAVTVYLKDFEDPVILVSSQGALLHFEEKAKDVLNSKLT